MNTTLDSLSYGVPLVAIPITFEQPGTGARIRSTKVGEVLSLSKLSTSSLRLAIERVLTEKSYTNNARRIQQSIQTSGGVARAANIIEQVIQGNRGRCSVSDMRGIPKGIPTNTIIGIDGNV